MMKDRYLKLLKNFFKFFVGLVEIIFAFEFQSVFLNGCRATRLETSTTTTASTRTLRSATAHDASPSSAAVKASLTSTPSAWRSAFHRGALGLAVDLSRWGSAWMMVQHVHDWWSIWNDEIREMIEANDVKEKRMYLNAFRHVKQRLQRTKDQACVKKQYLINTFCLIRDWKSWSWRR